MVVGASGASSSSSSEEEKDEDELKDIPDYMKTKEGYLKDGELTLEGIALIKTLKD